VSAAQKRVLLVVGGGIAAYKSCELVRLMRKGGVDVTCVVTGAGQQFVTPMALAALSENKVYTDLFDLTDEAEMGHIQLSRQADLLVVCPATADLLAKMATGIADDLATTLILATDKPVMAVPAMNVRMWEHEATRRNVAALLEGGVKVLDPDEGPMACGEFGYGRLPEPEAIWAEIATQLGIAPASGKEPAKVADTKQAAEEGDTAALAEKGEQDGDDQPPTRPEWQDEEDYEEEEDSTSRLSGLGSLLASIIPRSTPKRSAEEIEAQYLEEGEAVEDGDASEADTLDAAGEEQDAPDDTPPQEPGDRQEPAPSPDLSASPLLATKGKAVSAPPIDAQAINHMVDPRKSAPEAIASTPADAPASADIAIEEDHGEAFDEAAAASLAQGQPLAGRHVVITAGPTWEAIDPVRYIANRSSGRQGFAIAAAAAAAGAKVTLVAGPVCLKTPKGVERVDVESAREMSEAVKRALPADIAVMVAAVADWRPKEYREEKMKKRRSAPPALVLTENPDILANIAASSERPRLVVGFAAETENVLENARAKRKSKGCDWIVANDVSGEVMGGARNRVQIVTGEGVESLDEMPKEQVALALVERMAAALEGTSDDA